MDFRTLFQENPALVQKKKKYANFKVTPIGGPDDILKWREMQGAKESIYRLKLKTRDNRIEAYEREIGEALDPPQVNHISWKEKFAFVKSERKRLQEKEAIVRDYVPEIPSPLPQPKLFQRLKTKIRELWNHANF